MPFRLVSPSLDFFLLVVFLIIICLVVENAWWMLNLPHFLEVSHTLPHALQLSPTKFLAG
jgi:hypothetical protein